MIKQKMYSNLARLFSVAFIACAATSGCARDDADAGSKQQEAQVLAQSMQALPTAPSMVSYRIAVGDGDRKGAHGADIVAASAIVKSDAGFHTKFPLVLPSQVPADLPVEVRLIGTELLGISPFSIQGKLVQGATILRTLPNASFSVQQGESSDQIKIQFTIQELRSFIADNAHGAVSVVLTLAGENDYAGREALKVSFDLQSPPSDVAQTVYIPASLFEKTKKVLIPDEYRRIHPAASGPDVALYLVGVVELKNNEAQGVSISVPYQLIHESNLVTRVKAVSSSECGNRPNEVISRASLTSNLRLIPFGPDRDTFAAKAALVGASSLFLAKGAVAQVGIYATKPDIFSVPPGNIVMQSVPSRCQAQCVSGAEGDWADGGKWGDSCVGCGRSGGNSGPSCFTCMREHSNWCRWQNWRSWTEYTGVPVGNAYSIEFVPESKGAFSQFTLSYRYQTVAPRPRRFSPSPIVLNEAN